MSVLMLDGSAVNWAKPPKPTDRVMWSRRDKYGRPVTGSLRSIAHLDHLDRLSVKRFGQHITVIQPPYNLGVAASAGTHDFDACFDVWIVGVSGEEQERFFRANGGGAYYRKPPTFSAHIHFFTLPPREGSYPDDDFALAGFKVGKFVDGGISLFGHKVASSQIGDYYAHKTALAGHAYDPSWFPGDTPGTSIGATIFDLDAYVARQRRLSKGQRLRVSVVNVPAKVGQRAWQECWNKARANGSIFGINESFRTEQRETYAALVQQSKDDAHPVSSFGVMSTPNPVFWSKKRFRRVDARVLLIHPKNTTAPNAQARPGFYAARYVTEVVLAQRSDERQFAILNTHFAANGKGVDKRWVRGSQKAGKRLVRRLVKEHHRAGRAVFVMGDTNIRKPFSMPEGFRWLRGLGIDKIGSTLPGTAKTFPAPTDHKHGVRATVRL